MITRADVDEARARIAGRVRRTPLVAVDPGAFPGPTWLKLEFLQHTGSFKARGAFNRIRLARFAAPLLTFAGAIPCSSIGRAFGC